MRAFPPALSSGLQSALGAAFIALGAQVSVPMAPVPMTLQTLAVLVAGGLGGLRVGVGAAALYLLAVLVGLPVLAEGVTAPGLSFVELKSAGYVVGFLPAAAVASRARAQPVIAIGLMMAAHAVILTFGAIWLAGFTGLGPAWTYGVQPFLAGAAVKSGLAGAVLIAAAKVSRGFRPG